MHSISVEKRRSDLTNTADVFGSMQTHSHAPPTLLNVQPLSAAIRASVGTRKKRERQPPNRWRKHRAISRHGASVMPDEWGDLSTRAASVAARNGQPDRHTPYVNLRSF